jgi:hypothetical protein
VPGPLRLCLDRIRLQPRAGDEIYRHGNRRARELLVILLEPTGGFVDRPLYAVLCGACALRLKYIGMRRRSGSAPE